MENTQKRRKIVIFSILDQFTQVLLRKYAIKSYRYKRIKHLKLTLDNFQETCRIVFIVRN